MAHGHRHGHAHDHGHGGDADRRSLATALGLILALMTAEVVTGVLAGSLALLADAGHMLTDAAALGLALWAAGVAARPPAGRFTFGYRRVEILAAQANGVTLLLVGAWILYEAVRRLVDPPQVHGGLVLVVALAGVAVNLAATAVLVRGSRRSLNVRAAVVHIATDLAAFAGTAVAGLLVLLTGWDRFDAVAGLAVCALCVWAAVGLLRESTRIFLEASPVDPDEVGRAIVAVPGVVEAHDLHVWTVGSGFPSLSAHVLVAPDSDCHVIRRSIEAMLAERFGLEHTTLQVDHVGPAGEASVELGPAYRRRAPL